MIPLFFLKSIETFTGQQKNIDVWRLTWMEFIKECFLLKKKKYAAVKVQFNKDGSSIDVIKQKGLDTVRRYWSLMSKEIGNFCLEQILSGRQREDVVEAIHLKLQKVQEEMRSGQIELDKYVITKSLTKSPEEYNDARSQPHVQVALRMKQMGTEWVVQLVILSQM